MKVKICGITNLDDAIAASQAGADYLGFIFYPPSKRSIDQAAAAEIAQRLRQQPICPLLVGVFVNETGAVMAQLLEACQLDLAQLSGEEVPSLIGDVHSPIYGRCYKALRPTTMAEAEADAEWFLPPHSTAADPIHPTLLLDTYHPTLPGGTGATSDWDIAAKLARTIPGLMLAGGLTADNVASAVRHVQPFAVDVASGVEAYPGKKDHQRMRAFIHQAKSVAAPSAG